MKQIYGNGISIGGGPLNSDCICEPTIPEDVILLNFQRTLTLLKETVGKLYTIVVVTAPGIGSMTLTGRAPFVVLVRLKWVEVYGTGQKFDIKNQVHLGQIKDIYLENKRDWRNDPLFRV